MHEEETPGNPHYDRAVRRLGVVGPVISGACADSDTVRVVQEDGDQEAGTLEWSFGSSLFLDLLNAGRDKITPRSRLLTDISSFWEALHDRDSNQ